MTIGRTKEGRIKRGYKLSRGGRVVKAAVKRSVKRKVKRRVAKVGRRVLDLGGRGGLRKIRRKVRRKAKAKRKVKRKVKRKAAAPPAFKLDEGALHRRFGIPLTRLIPVGRIRADLRAAIAAHNTRHIRQDEFALNARKWRFASGSRKWRHA